MLKDRELYPSVQGQGNVTLEVDLSPHFQGQGIFRSGSTTSSSGTGKSARVDLLSFIKPGDKKSVQVELLPQVQKKGSNSNPIEGV